MMLFFQKWREENHEVHQKWEVRDVLHFLPVQFPLEPSVCVLHEEASSLLVHRAYPTKLLGDGPAPMKEGTVQRFHEPHPIQAPDPCASLRHDHLRRFAHSSRTSFLAGGPSLNNATKADAPHLGGEAEMWTTRQCFCLLTEQEFFGTEFFDGVAEFYCFFEFEFLGGFAHVG